MYFYGGTTLLQWWLNSPQRKESCTILPFFFYTLPVDRLRLLQLVQLSHYIKQVNPPKFYLQHLVWGSYLSSLQNGTICKTWLNSAGLPLLVRVTLGKVSPAALAKSVFWALNECKSVDLFKCEREMLTHWQIKGAQKISYWRVSTSTLYWMSDYRSCQLFPVPTIVWIQLMFVYTRQTLRTRLHASCSAPRNSSGTHQCGNLSKNALSRHLLCILVSHWLPLLGASRPGGATWAIYVVITDQNFAVKGCPFQHRPRPARDVKMVSISLFF